MESRNYDGLLEKVYQTGRKKHILYGIMLLIITVFANTLILIILYFGGQMCIDGDLTIGNLTSFVLYTISLTVGFASVSGIVNQLISAMGICEHLFEIMDEPVKVVPGILKPEFAQVNGPMVEFVNASFYYPSKPTVRVLNNINLKINHGESVAIVGPSGSGKSSIVSLILRFYDLNEGQIIINGKPIKEISTGLLREQIGFVSQEPTLFSGNLRENIEYGLR
jgi:ABC-type multidrug transport system fused ATPase/permease subunit